MSERAKQIVGMAVPDRWMVEIIYSDSAPRQLMTIGEIEELDEIVERGPDWNKIERIVITLNRPSVEPRKEMT